MRVLLDTHALLWWVDDDRQLPAKARAVIASFKTEVYVSAASAWEIATKVRIGKLAGAGAFAADFPARLQQLSFRELPSPSSTGNGRACCRGLIGIHSTAC